MQPFWRITLLDNLTLFPVWESEDPRAQQNTTGEVRRFRSQKSAALLAYLALHVGRPCSRDVLCDALWPDEGDMDAARNRLRVVLASLRKQMEPPGVPRGFVLDASVPNTVRLRSESVWVDVAAFEAAVKNGDFQTARDLFTGELLPTFYDEWILRERERLNGLLQSLPAARNTAPNLSEPLSSLAEKKTSDALPPARHHLPLYLTRFFGREAERERIRALLSEPRCRLITLTGAGGQGKTRLSVEAAGEQKARPVWFVPLADVWEGDRLGDALQSALDLPRTDIPALSQVIAFFQGQDAPLLLLDNLEQIAPAAAPVLTALLQHVPDLTLLLTSRVRLEIPGEQEIPVVPLPTPEPTAPDGIDLTVSAQFASVALFLDRAQNVRPDFQITERNAADILGICQRLEGIPLGLELAAARSASLTPSQMRQKLTDHWDALPARGKTEKAHRHRSLRAAIEWSVALLPLDQRRLFIQLSVFQGGATLEAIEAVCQSPNTLDTLTRLRASSLVLLTEQSGVFRYTLLEVLRQWAFEQLAMDDKDALAARHATWFYRFAESRKATLSHLSGVAALEAMEAEAANFRAALAHCQTENLSLYVDFTLALTGFWEHKSDLIEAQKWLEGAQRVLETIDGDAATEKRIKVLLALGTNAGRQGNADAALAYLQKTRDLNAPLSDALEAAICWATGRAYWVKGALPDALAQFEESNRLYQAAGDSVGRAATLSNIGAALRDSGDYDGARRAFTEAIQLSRQHDLPRTLASALNNFAALRHILGETGVQELYEESLALQSALRMPSGVAVILSNLALLHCRQKNWGEGRRLTEEANVLLRATGNRRNLAISLSRLGQIADAEGKHDEAKRHFLESLRLRLAGGNPHDIIIALIAFSEHAFSVKKITKAAQILGAVQTHLDAWQTPLPVDEQAEFEQHCVLVQAALPVAAFKKACREGASWSQAELLQRLQR